MSCLQKSVCQDCMARIRPVNGHVLRATGEKVRSDKPVPWTKNDRVWWAEGKVVCPDGVSILSFDEAWKSCRRKKWHEAAGDGSLLVMGEKRK